MSKWFELFMLVSAMKPKIDFERNMVTFDGNDLAKIDADVMALVQSVQFQLEASAMATVYSRNLNWGRDWAVFHKANMNLRKVDAQIALQSMLAKLQSIETEELPALDTWTVALMKIVDNDLASMLQERGTEFKDFSTYHLGLGRTLIALAHLMHDGRIRADQMRILLSAQLEAIPGTGLEELILEHRSLFEEVEGDELDTILDEVIASNAKAVQEIKDGKDKAVGALVGQILKKFKADPAAVKTKLFTKIRG